MRSANSSIHQFNDLTIRIANRQRVKKIDSRLLEKIVAELLAELEIENAELEINLVGAKAMTLLNEKFLQHEGSTDVITFDYVEKMLASSSLHGEIFACVDEAILQAKKFDTTWQPEIVRYIVHGVLHLRGHDDRHVIARAKMKRKENFLLRKLSRRFALSKL
jgi:probable rRNA maturation factor